MAERRGGERRRRRVVHLQPAGAQRALDLGEGLGVGEAERGQRLVAIDRREKRRDLRGLARRRARDDDLRTNELGRGRHVWDELRHRQTRLIEDAVHHRNRIEDAGDDCRLDAGELDGLRQRVLEHSDPVALAAAGERGEVARLKVGELLPALDLDVGQLAVEDGPHLPGDVGKGKRIRAEDAADVSELGGDVESALAVPHPPERQQLVGATGDVWRGEVDEVRWRPNQRRDDTGGKAPRQRVPEAAAALSGRHDDEEVRKRSGARCVGTRTRGDEVRHRIHGLAPRVERLDLSHGRPKPAPPAPSGCRARPP